MSTTVFEKPQIVAHVHKSIDHTVYQAHWIPSSPKFVVLGCTPRDHGTIEVFELCRGEAKPVTRHEIATPIKCGTFGATSIRQRQLATGNFKGRLHIWDLERLGGGEPVLTYRNAHEGLINHIDGVGGLGIGEGAAEIVTAGRDGRVRVWDPRQADEPVATMSADSSGSSSTQNEAPLAGGDATATTVTTTPRDCWAVAFGHAYTPQERCVAAGYDNGDIKLFDLRVMKTRWSHNVKNGVCALEFDRRDICMNKLVATTLESKFFVFDMRTQHEQEGFAYLTEKAHRSTIWCAKHLPQNRDVFMTAGGSGTMCLWKYNYPSSRVKKDDKGQPMGAMGTLELLQDVALSQQPICHFSWSPDKIGLGLCSSFDQSVNVVIVTRLNTV